MARTASGSSIGIVIVGFIINSQRMLAGNSTKVPGGRVTKLINIARKQYRESLNRRPATAHRIQGLQRNTGQLAHRAISTIGPDEIAGGHGFRLAGFGVAQTYCGMRLVCSRIDDRPASLSVSKRARLSRKWRSTSGWRKKISAGQPAVCGNRPSSKRISEAPRPLTKFSELLLTLWAVPYRQCRWIGKSALFRRQNVHPPNVKNLRCWVDHQRGDVVVA